MVGVFTTNQLREHVLRKAPGDRTMGLLRKKPTSVVASSDLPKKKIPFLDELSMWEVTRPGKR